jgi:hypothetical protein
MKLFKKLIILIFAITLNVGLFSCDIFLDTSKEYNVTWINYDGKILEEDINVKVGVVPTYDGSTPIRKGDSEHRYSFIGWDPTIVSVQKDAIYSATYSERIIDPDEEYFDYTRKDGIVESLTVTEGEELSFAQVSLNNKLSSLIGNNVIFEDLILHKNTLYLKTKVIVQKRLI